MHAYCYWLLIKLIVPVSVYACFRLCQVLVLIQSDKIINSMIIAGLEVVDTCSDEQTAAWQIIKTLGRLSLDGSVNETNPLRVILASQLNSELRSRVSQLSSLSPRQPQTSLSVPLSLTPRPRPSPKTRPQTQGPAHFYS